jgi:transposase
MSAAADHVVIGMDPHKRSVTIEVMTAGEQVLGGGRFDTDADGYRSMLRYAKRWGSRIWAIEGCQGIGKHVALRLLADCEDVVDVPPKLSARARVFATGQGRKTDAADAHCVALVGTRMSGLQPVINDEQLAVLRVLVDRRRSLGEDHTRMGSQLHQLLLELIPGGAKKDLSAAQAKALLSKVRPRDAAGKTRRRVAAELIADLERIYQRMKAANKELAELVAATGTTLMDLHGIGPSGAARLLVEIGDITRFPDRSHFASWNGTAPIDALATTPVEDLLSLPMLQPDRVTDPLNAYQVAKRGNVLRVMAEAVKWGRRGARVNAIRPGIIITPLARDELTGPRSEGYREMLSRSPAGRAGSPDEVATVGALLMGPDGACSSPAVTS